MNPGNSPKFHPVTASRHSSSWWHPCTSYSWAAGEAIVGLVGSELARAALHMPIAFVKHNDAFLPAAVTGLEMGVSLFIAEDGRWTGGYIPALLRSRPFVLLPAADGRKVLCVDEAAARTGSEPEPGGQPFFEADGKLSSTLQHFMDFLSAIEGYREPTLKACEALQGNGLVVPWKIELKTHTGTRALEGLYRVDEAALNELDNDAFLALRRLGALPMAYAQLLSMAQFPALGERASARMAAVKSTPPLTAGGDLDLSFLERGDTLRFL